MDDPELLARGHGQEMRRMEELRAEMGDLTAEQARFLRRLACEHAAAGLPVPAYAEQLLADHEIGATMHKHMYSRDHFEALDVAACRILTDIERVVHIDGMPPVLRAWYDAVARHGGTSPAPIGPDRDEDPEDWLERIIQWGPVESRRHNTAYRELASARAASAIRLARLLVDARVHQRWHELLAHGIGRIAGSLVVDHEEHAMTLHREYAAELAAGAGDSAP